MSNGVVGSQYLLVALSLGERVSELRRLRRLRTETLNATVAEDLAGYRPADGKRLPASFS